MTSAKTMLKSGMSSSRKYVTQASQLFDISQLLKLWRVNKIPNSFLKSNESVNVIENLSLLIFFLMFAIAILVCLLFLIFMALILRFFLRTHYGV